MKLQFLSKTKINNNFLNQILNQIRNETQKRLLNSSDRKILKNLENDLERQKKHGTNIRQVNNQFILQENEYNFLIRNQRSIWAKYLIFRYKFKIFPQSKKLIEFPLHLLIEPTPICNLRCIMCFQSDKSFKETVPQGFMELPLFKKIIDQAHLAGCQAVTLASRGEPLLHPMLEKMLTHAKGKFFDFKLNTNATLLDERKSHQILENNVTELVFSVDAFQKKEYERIRRGGNFNRVLKNIKTFHDIRRHDYPNSKCKTRVSGVNYGPEFNSNKFVKFWTPLADEVVCATKENFSNTYNEKPSDKATPCPSLWSAVYVWYDGTVNPCDYDYKSFLRMGDVKTESLKKIWQNKKFIELRKDHLRGKRQHHFPCDRCDNQ